jgi:hypothetical protein
MLLTLLAERLGTIVNADRTVIATHKCGSRLVARGGRHVHKVECDECGPIQLAEVEADLKGEVISKSSDTNSHLSDDVALAMRLHAAGGCKGDAVFDETNSTLTCTACELHEATLGELGRGFGSALAEDESDAAPATEAIETPQNELPRYRAPTSINGRREDTEQLREQIRGNPRRAFELVLGRALVEKAGSREPVALCPLHDDSKPSLRINLEKSTWFCDPCNQGGDLFDLCAAISNTSFPQTKAKIAGLLNGAHFNGTEAITQSAAKRKLLRTIHYELRDLAGEIRAIHIRNEFNDGSKSMPWKLPDGTDGLGGMAVAELPLYGINRAADAARGEPAILCEGEKCVDSLWARRVLAVGTVTGAGKGKPIPSDASLRPLLSLKVYSWPDNDEIGRDHLGRVCARLAELGHRDIWQIDWKDAPPKGDAADFEGDPSSLIEAATPFNSDYQAEPQVDPWPEPLPIDAGLPDVMPLLPEMLPTRLRAYAVDIASRLSVPLDIPAFGLLVTTTPLIGRQIAIRPKRRDDWAVRASLWGAVVARPGVLLKTPSLQQALKPLQRVDAAAAKDSGTEFEQKMRLARRKKLQGQIEKAGAGDETIDVVALEAEHDRLSDPPHHLENDTSIEKLIETFRQNPDLLLYRDELMGWLRSMEREGHEGDRAFYLETWESHGPYRQARIGRGEVVVPDRFLSILGGVQPEPLVDYLNENFTHGLNDGLIQRFNVVWPDEPEYVHADQYVDSDAREEVAALFRELAGFSPDLIGAESDPFEARARFVRFDAAAQARFDEWLTSLERRIRAKGDAEHPVILEHLGKFRSLNPKLALLFFILENIGKAEPLRQVPLECEERAIGWCAYFESHARRVYHAVLKKEQLGARNLADKIMQKQLPDLFRARDVYRHHWNGLRTKEAALSALEIIESAGWVMSDPGERRSIVYHVNPKLFREMTGTHVTHTSYTYTEKESECDG